jgi:hypothetical protein
MRLVNNYPVQLVSHLEARNAHKQNYRCTPCLAEVEMSDAQAAMTGCQLPQLMLSYVVNGTR